MKKALTLFLAAMLLAGVFAGCAGSNHTATSAATTTASTSAPAASTSAATSAEATTAPVASASAAPVAYSPMTLSTMTTSQEAATNRDTDLFASALLETFNVTLDVEYIAQSSIEETMKLRYMSDENPDVEFNTFCNLDSYGVEGFYVAFDDYFDQMPNMRALWPDDFWAEYLDLTEQSDGKHYSLRVPTGAVQLVGEGFLYRMSGIEEFGVELPKTTEEFYEYLKQIKEKYPDSIPYSFRNALWGASQGFYRAFRTSDGFAYDKDYGAFTYEPVTDKFRDCQKYMARLFADGLMAPEFATQSAEQWAEQIGSGKVYVTHDYFARESWANNLCAEVDPEANWLSSHEFLNAYPDKKLFVSRYSSVGGSSARIATHNTQEEIDRIIEIFDWLCTDEGARRTQMGVEGVTYTFNADGEEEYLPNIITPLNADQGTDTLLKYNLEYRMRYYPRFFYYQGGGPSYDITQEVLANNYDYFPLYNLVLSEDDATVAADIGTVLGDMMEQYSVKFIMGQLDVGDDAVWESYVADMNKNGLEKLLPIYASYYNQKYGE